MGEPGLADGIVSLKRGGATRIEPADLDIPVETR